MINIKKFIEIEKTASIKLDQMTRVFVDTPREELKDMSYARFKELYPEYLDIVNENPLLVSFGSRWGLNLFDYLVYRHLNDWCVNSLTTLKAMYGVSRQSKDSWKLLDANYAWWKLYQCAKARKQNWKAIKEAFNGKL